MQSIRIYEMPPCKMVSSGKGMFGDENFTKFHEWFTSQEREMFPRNFLYGEDDGFVWLYMLVDGAAVPTGFEIVDFPGGLYATATDIDQKTDVDHMNSEVDRFLGENGFERDSSRPELGSVITTPQVSEVLGYNQMDYYFPIKAK